jgi:serine/threonine protein kinase
VAQTSKKFCSSCLKEVSTESYKCPGCNGPLTILHSRDLVGEILDGRFEVLELLGKGGMGIVYRARHRYLERDCAIKVLRADSADDPLAVARFLREAKSVSGLSSPNTVRVTDFGVSPDGLLYLVMELLKGESLGQKLHRCGSISWRKAFEYSIQVCHSLQEAHSRQLWHRDIKPDNIFIVREEGEEVAKVLDFGIAKLGDRQETSTEAGIICGTPEYLSPEQARGKEVDGRTDIYSLGAVLYEAIAGHPPFEGDTAVKVLMCHIMDKPTHLKDLELPASIPKQVMDLVMWTLKKKAQRRPAGVEELAAAMQEMLDVFPDDQSPSPEPRALKPTPTGLQYMPMVAEEETEDEIDAVDEETTGDFTFSEDRIAADLAIRHESTAEALYSSAEQTLSATESFESPQTVRKYKWFSLLGIITVLALAAWGGSHLLNQNQSTSAAAGQNGATVAPGQDVVPGPIADIRPDHSRQVDRQSQDTTSAPADLTPDAVHFAALKDASNTDGIAPSDITLLAANELSLVDAVSIADLKVSDQLAGDTFGLDANGGDLVDRVEATQQDLTTTASSKEEVARERKERHRRRAEERRKRKEEQRKKEENRLEQEKLKQEAAARKEKEKEKENGKEKEKDPDEDEDDGYTRIPGGK